MRPAQSQSQKGESIISLLVGIAIFLILISTVFTLVRTSFLVSSYNRARIGAQHLGQEKIEFIRNLSYDKVGTSGGIPTGAIIQEENILRNGLNYRVSTDIVYVDDPFDSTAPTDLLPTDYKRIRVEVNWDGIAASRGNPVVFVTDIAPKGVESTAGGGTLSILVYDANGEPVSQATATITAATTPAVNLTLDTGTNGRIILPGAPPCTACYQITITKNGYSTERTYATTEVANPAKPHNTILAGQLTEVSFSIDQLSSITLNSVNSRENDFDPLANVSFNVRGDKTIGTDTNGNPVYKYEEVLTTDSAGQLNLSDFEWDTYEITLPASSSYDIAGANPFLPLVVNPNETKTQSIVLTTKSLHNLLLNFTTQSSTPIASISATLSRGSYIETILSGTESSPDFGSAFFPSLTEDDFSLTATASGYVDYSGTVSVSGKTLQTIIMTAQ